MKLIYALLFLITSTISLGKSSVSFNTMGNIIPPDSALITQGKKDNRKGYIDDANKQFKKAAEFGNEQAKILLANNYIKQQNHPQALAWLKLIDPSLLKKHNQISQSIKTLRLMLTKEQQRTSQILYEQLQQQYSASATQLKRQEWRNNLQFTGTRIKGKVPAQLTVLPIENGILGINTITITGHEIRSQLDQYVNEYDLKLPKGQVTLAPIETAESKEPQ